MRIGGDLHSPLAKYVLSNQEVSVHVSPVSLLKGAYSLGELLGTCVYQAGMLKALILLKEVSHVSQPLLYTRVIDDATNRSAMYREVVFFPFRFYCPFYTLKCNAAMSGFVF